MDQDVETRLTRPGVLTEAQATAALEEFGSLDAEGQAEFKEWLNSVHDYDIQERFGDAPKQQAAGEGDDNQARDPGNA